MIGEEFFTTCFSVRFVFREWHDDAQGNCTLRGFSFDDGTMAVLHALVRLNEDKLTGRDRPGVTIQMAL